MRFRREESQFEKPDYDIQHRRGVMPSKPSESVAQKTGSVPVSRQRFVEQDDRPGYDDYPDDRDRG